MQEVSLRNISAELAERENLMLLLSLLLLWIVTNNSYMASTYYHIGGLKRVEPFKIT